jgi:hypothetical protein
MENNSIHMLEKERILNKTMIMMKRSNNNMEIHMEKKAKQTILN